MFTTAFLRKCVQHITNANHSHFDFITGALATFCWIRAEQIRIAAKSTRPPDSRREALRSAGARAATRPCYQWLLCLPIFGAVRTLSTMVTARMATTAPSETSTGILMMSIIIIFTPMKASTTARP